MSFRDIKRRILRDPRECPIERLQERYVLDAIIADENRVRLYTLVVIDCHGNRYEIPVRTSRRLVRKAKLAIAEIGLDALTPER